MKRISLVEDDEVYADFLKKTFEKDEKYKVEVFGNAEDCLLELESKINPQILIIDYFLPGMNGIDLYERIRKSYRNIRLIMLSSNTDVSLVVDLVRQGIRNYVIKDENVVDSLIAVIEENDDLLIDLYSE